MMSGGALMAHWGDSAIVVIVVLGNVGLPCHVGAATNTTSREGPTPVGWDPRKTGLPPPDPAAAARGGRAALAPSFVLTATRRALHPLGTRAHP